MHKYFFRVVIVGEVEFLLRWLLYTDFWVVAWLHCVMGLHRVYIIVWFIEWLIILILRRSIPYLPCSSNLAISPNNPNTLLCNELWPFIYITWVLLMNMIRVPSAWLLLTLIQQEWWIVHIVSLLCSSYCRLSSLLWKQFLLLSFLYYKLLILNISLWVIWFFSEWTVSFKVRCFQVRTELVGDWLIVVIRVILNY